MPRDRPGGRGHFVLLLDADLVDPSDPMIDEKRSLLIVNGRFEYRDERFPMGSDCACFLRVWMLADGWHLVIATELDPSHGASVTNSAERWAEEACKEYGLDPFKTIFVEHYDHRVLRNETFDIVTFRWRYGLASGPEWKHSTRAAVQELIGEELP